MEVHVVLKIEIKLRYLRYENRLWSIDIRFYLKVVLLHTDLNNEQCLKCLKMRDILQHSIFLSEVLEPSTLENTIQRKPPTD